MSGSSIDSIYLRNLHLLAVVGDDAWGRADKAQPVLVSLRLHRDTLRASTSDDVADTFSYGQMCKDVIALVDGKKFTGLDALDGRIRRISESWAGELLECLVELPKGLLRVEGGLGRVVIVQRKAPDEWQIVSSQWIIRKIKAACIIGVNPHERLNKQAVSVDIRISNTGEHDDHETPPRSSNELWRTVTYEALQTVESSTFETLEALAASVCSMLFAKFSFPEVTISVEKPSALNLVEASGVEIRRTQ